MGRREQGRGLHSSASQLNLSRFVTETTAKSAHIRPKSGRLCTAVFGPSRGLHSSASPLNLSRVWSLKPFNQPTYLTKSAHVKPKSGRVEAPESRWGWRRWGGRR